MFDKVGQFSSKYRYPIIVAWVVLLVTITALAPNLADVAISEQSGYLPDDEPSVVAADVAAEYFPDKASPTQAVLVFKSETGSLRDEAVQTYLADLTAWLENDLSPGVISQVLSPVEPALADQLISEDGQAGMIFISLRGVPQDAAVVAALEAMQGRLDEAPAGLTGYITGGAAITNDYQANALESADRTTLITIILVIVVLLIIYRSPVAPIVPLATIAVAYGVSRGLLAWLTNFGWTVSSMTDIFLVVILFGAGTDYCLFLVSRFREFMADDLPGPTAARRTVERVGETITSSAGTVIVGMVAMSFAEMKLFASSGPSLALGIVVALLAGLTLTPALLAVLGRRAFWPGRPRHAGEGGFWGRLAGWVTARPWLPLILAVIVLLPLAIYGQGQRRTFDLLADLPDDVPSKAGFLLLSEHFGAGEVQPLDVIVTTISDTRSPEGMARIHALTQDLLAMEGVADVRSLTLPAGRSAPELGDALRVDGQLTLMADAIDDLRAQASDLSAMAEMDVSEATAGFDTLRAYLDELAAVFPDLSSNADYQAVCDALDRLAEAIETGRQRLLVSNQLAEAAAGITGARAQLGQADVAAVEKLDETTAQFAVLRAYLTGLAETYPAVAGMNGYDDVLDALESLETAVMDITDMLLVSTQLDALAEALSGMATALEDPAALAELSASPGQVEALAVLDAYLQELVAAYPSLGEQPAYQSATEHLAAVQSAVDEMAQGLLVSNQLVLIARQMDDTAQSLEEDPSALMPQPGEPSAAEQMAVLSAYLEELGAAYPSLAATEDYKTATRVLEGMAQGNLLSGQLALIAQQMDDMAQALEENPLALMPQPGEPTAAEQMAILSAYLEELGAAYPSLAATEDYQTATTVVEEMGAALETIDLAKAAELIAQAQESLPVLSNAFAGLSATAAETLPEATFMPENLPGDVTALMPDLTAVQESLATLSAAFAGLSAMAAETLPQATFMPEGLSEGMMAFAPDLAGLAAEITAAGDDFAALAEIVRQEIPDATFVPETALPSTEAVPDPMPVLEASLDDLAAALNRLSTAAATALPEATYVPSGDLADDEAQAAVEAVLADVDALQAALRALADDLVARDDAFFIPALAEEESAGLTQLLDTYTSPAGDAARLQVILADEPFSPAALETVARLRDEVSRAIQGYVSGTSAILLDLQDVMERDLVRVMALVLAGIAVVLVLLLRSLVAPVYLLATILLSYGATLGLTRLVFDGIFHEGLTWWAPFFMFVLLVSLGMDYNIFLMGRVKEEVAGHGTRAGVERAVQRTGGIITSAGIIMAGTFAAMMSSSLLGLVQLAFAVTVGVLLDTFVIRTTLVPAIVVLLDRWNWWPGKGPAK